MTAILVLHGPRSARPGSATIGWIVAVGAWLLHVSALSLPPLSIVQAIMSGGIVFLAVIGEHYSSNSDRPSRLRSTAPSAPTGHRPADACA